MFFKVFVLKLLQYSQENACVGSSFFVKCQAFRRGTPLKRDSNTRRQGKGGNNFCSSLPPPSSHEHSNIYLHQCM